MVRGYRVAVNRDRVVAGDDLATIDGASAQELAQRCSADCTCNSFNSNVRACEDEGRASGLCPFVLRAT